MDTLIFQQQRPDTVYLTNDFIEKYFADATGNSIKVYIYMQYCCNMGLSCTSDEIADACHMDMVDVEYALRFWKKKKLIGSSKLEDGTVIVNIGPSKCPVTEKPKYVMPKAVDIKEKPAEVPVVRPSLNDKASLDATIIKVAETFRGCPLSEEDRDNLYILTAEYDYKLDMFVELADYVSKHFKGAKARKTSTLVDTAKQWQENNITTLDDMIAVKKNQAIFDTVASKLNFEGGLSTQQELEVRAWLDLMGMPQEVIAFAADETVRNAHPLKDGSFSFKYLQKIIQDYNEKNLKSLAAIKTAKENKNSKVRKVNFTVDVTRPSNNANFNTAVNTEYYRSVGINNLKKLAKNYDLNSDKEDKQ